MLALEKDTKLIPIEKLNKIKGEDFNTPTWASSLKIEKDINQTINNFKYIINSNEIYNKNFQESRLKYDKIIELNNFVLLKYLITTDYNNLTYSFIKIEEITNHITLPLINDFFIKLNSLNMLNDISNGLDLIFNKIDDLILVGNFDVINMIISKVDVSKLNTNYLLGFLCITIDWKVEIPLRKDLWIKIKDRVLKEYSKTYAEELLNGLE